MKGFKANATVKSLGPPGGPVTGALTNTKLLKTVMSSAPTLLANSVPKVLGVLLVVERSMRTLSKRIIKEALVTEPSGRKAIWVIFSGPVDEGNCEAE